MKKALIFTFSSLFALSALSTTSNSAFASTINEEEEFKTLLESVKEEEKFEEGFKEDSIIQTLTLNEDESNDDLNRIAELVDENPELSKHTEAYKVWTNDDEFNDLFEGTELNAEAGETDDVTYVFNDGSSLSASLSTESVENEVSPLAITEPDPYNDGWFSNYVHTFSVLWINNAQTQTAAYWSNAVNSSNNFYANVYDHQGVVDVTPGSGSGSTRVVVNNNRNSIVQGTFELNDPFGAATFTRLVDLTLHADFIPSASAEVVR
ncbi:hypothetical protein [Shouchella hunanensis]|uniref:Uncharacterized protein n=1 Tax=Shouchella hunanensis TaxID=766894 RepID=A0ABY7W9M3_9BACI|nr:hypothetical protein [Shouchella hunanensis]WDF04540.1 hypothetical protein PQ477_03420 [Shouchella hunanensis]